MLNDFFDRFGFLSPLLWLLVPLAFLLPNRFFGGKDLERKMEEMRQHAALAKQEKAEFQQQLLTEFRRHNDVMERQSQILSRLLERIER